MLGFLKRKNKKIEELELKISILEKMMLENFEKLNKKSFGYLRVGNEMDEGKFIYLNEQIEKTQDKILELGKIVHTLQTAIKLQEKPLYDKLEVQFKEFQLPRNEVDVLIFYCNMPLPNVSFKAIREEIQRELASMGVRIPIMILGNELEVVNVKGTDKIEP